MIFGLSVASSNRGFMGGASSQAPESAARSSPGGGLGNERQGHAAWLAAAQSPPRALLSSLRNSHAISRRRAIGYALDQRFACSLRPIFCAFAPFAATLPPVPRGHRNGRQGRTAGFGHKRALRRFWRVSPGRELSYAPSLTATRPSLFGRRIPPFEDWRRHAAAR
jgi:hypothetical protein